MEGGRELLVWCETIISLKCLLKQRPQFGLFKKVFTQLDLEPSTPAAVGIKGVLSSTSKEKADGAQYVFTKQSGLSGI